MKMRSNQSMTTVTAVLAMGVGMVLMIGVKNALARPQQPHSGVGTLDDLNIQRRQVSTSGK